MDGNTLVERTNNNQHNDSWVKSSHHAETNLMLIWMTYLSIGNLQRQLSFLVLIIRMEKEMMSLMD